MPIKAPCMERGASEYANSRPAEREEGLPKGLGEEQRTGSGPSLLGHSPHPTPPSLPPGLPRMAPCLCPAHLPCLDMSSWLLPHCCLPSAPSSWVSHFSDGTAEPARPSPSLSPTLSAQLSHHHHIILIQPQKSLPKVCLRPCFLCPGPHEQREGREDPRLPRGL